MSRTDEKMSVVETEHGLVFVLDEDKRITSSIVVEVKTQNRPLIYGAGDLGLPEDRTSMITVTKSGIIIRKGDDTELAVPVNIADENEAKIYLYGRNSHVWTWFKVAGESFIKEVQLVEHGMKDVCLCTKGLWMFVDHTRLIRVS